MAILPFIDDNDTDHRTADAEDAWSETFWAALRACPDLPRDANLEAWLVTIAHRKAINTWPSVESLR